LSSGCVSGTARCCLRCIARSLRLGRRISCGLRGIRRGRLRRRLRLRGIRRGRVACGCRLDVSRVTCRSRGGRSIRCGRGTTRSVSRIATHGRGSGGIGCHCACSHACVSRRLYCCSACSCIRRRSRRIASDGCGRDCGAGLLRSVRRGLYCRLGRVRCSGRSARFHPRSSRPSHASSCRSVSVDIGCSLCRSRCCCGRIGGRSGRSCVTSARGRARSARIHRGRRSGRLVVSRRRGGRRVSRGCRLCRRIRSRSVRSGRRRRCVGGSCCRCRRGCARVRRRSGGCGSRSVRGQRLRCVSRRVRCDGSCLRRSGCVRAGRRSVGHGCRLRNRIASGILLVAATDRLLCGGCGGGSGVPSTTGDRGCCGCVGGCGLDIRRSCAGLSGNQLGSCRFRREAGGLNQTAGIERFARLQRIKLRLAVGCDVLDGGATHERRGSLLNRVGHVHSKLVG
jgi:hypothetical protein